MSDLTNGKIEAAITRLEGLRGSISERDFKVMTHYASGADSGIALLSLILHRTIDAQLAILYQFAEYPNVQLEEAVIGLADAITGGTE
jgi:hypothetical protein